MLPGDGERVAVPPKRDSHALRHEQSELLLAAAGALRSEACRGLESGMGVKRQPSPADDERARIVGFCGGTSQELSAGFNLIVHLFVSESALLAAEGAE